MHRLLAACRVFARVARPLRSVALLLLAALGSRAAPATIYPPLVRPTSGVVHGQAGRVLFSDFDEVGDAATVARMLDAYFAPAAKRFGYTNPAPLEVWLDYDWPFQWTTMPRCIVLNPSIGGMQGAEIILVHELVHWHAQASPIATSLPHPIVEGICERIACDLVERWRAERRAQLEGGLQALRESGELPRLIALLGVDIRRYERLSSEDRIGLSMLGFALVDRIGVEALLEAAKRGPVTQEALLAIGRIDAAGVGL